MLVRLLWEFAYMIRFRLPLITLAVMGLAASSASAGATGATAKIVDAAGAEVGTASLTEGPSGVLVTVAAKGLTPGWHGMHLHEFGVCSADGFKGAGAHMGHHPGAAHGLLSTGGPEAGDLPNLYAGVDGTATVEVYTEHVTLDPAKASASRLLVKEGAVVIHAARDDQSSQPIGGSGARVACGVIKLN